MVIVEKDAWEGEGCTKHGVVEEEEDEEDEDEDDWNNFECSWGEKRDDNRHGQRHEEKVVGVGIGSKLCKNSEDGDMDTVIVGLAY
jgi:hypothetical protein